MKKVKQTKLHNPPTKRGNCFRAVISSFTGVSIDEIPPFEDMMHEDNWATKALSYLSGIGWDWLSIDGHLNNDEYYLVIGESPRGVPHVCIYLNGELWHDPHPSDGGLVTEDHFEALCRLPEGEYSHNYSLSTMFEGIEDVSKEIESLSDGEKFQVTRWVNQRLDIQFNNEGFLIDMLKYIDVLKSNIDERD